MIVKCERCQTRFKIPDEKVTEKGVKVRCTKCQNTFRVAREPASDASVPLPAPGPAGQADPFARFGVAPDPKGVEITRPGFYATGVEASRAPAAVPLPAPAAPPPAPWNSVDVDVDMDDGVFQEPTRIIPLPLPVDARPPGAPASTPFDFDNLPVPAGTGGAGARGTGPGVAAPSAPRAAPPGAFAPPPPPPPAVDFGAPGEDPFADFMTGAGPGPASGPLTSDFDLSVDDLAPGAGSVPPGLAPAPRGGTPGAASPRAAPPGAFAPPTPPGPRAAPPGAFPAAAPRAVPPPAPAMAQGPAGPQGEPRAPGAGAPPPAAVAPGAAPPRAGSVPPGLAPSPGAAARGAPPPAAFAGLPTPPPPPAAAFAGPPAAPPPPPTAFAGPPAASAATVAPGQGSAGPRTAPSTRPAAVIGFPASAPAPDAEALRRAASAPSAAPTGAMALGPQQPAPAAAAAPSPFDGEDPFASIDVDLASPGPAPDAPEPAAEPPPAAPLENLGDLFDLSGAPSGDVGLSPTDTGRAALLGAPPPAAPPPAEIPGVSLLGDLPPLNEAEEFKVSEPPRREVVDLDGVPAAAPAVAVAKPSARPEDVGIPQRRPPSRAGKVTAVLANVAVAAVLLVGLGALGRVYLREGRVDVTVLSPDRLRALVAPAPRPLVALDLSNGLYETREGRQLFVVRGEAENRGATATRVRVRAALFDEDQRVRSSEGLAGTMPTPEDLYGVTNADSATALRQRLDGGAATVAPGARAPFLLVFHEYPADLASFRLEVTLEPAPPAAEAGRKAE